MGNGWYSTSIGAVATLATGSAIAEVTVRSVPVGVSTFSATVETGRLKGVTMRTLRLESVVAPVVAVEAAAEPL